MLYQCFVFTVWRGACGQGSKHETLSHCWFNVGPPSTTLAQHWTNNDSMSRVCWEGSSNQAGGRVGKINAVLILRDKLSLAEGSASTLWVRSSADPVWLRLRRKQDSKLCVTLRGLSGSVFNVTEAMLSRSRRLRDRLSWDVHGPRVLQRWNIFVKPLEQKVFSIWNHQKHDKCLS